MIKITDAELEVIKVIWKMKETNTLEIIKQLEYCNWNNNTIRTLLNRLIAKKAVGISKKEGKIYIYVPLIDEEVYKFKKVKKFLEHLYNNSVFDMLLNFAKSGELTRIELEKIIELINKKHK